MRSRLALICASLALLQSTGAAAQSTDDLELLWDEQAAACNHPVGEIEAGIVAAGWEPADPEPGSYLEGALAALSEVVDMSRAAGVFPADFNPQLESAAWSKTIAGEETYIILFSMFPPDSNGAQLFDCSLMAPDYTGELSPALAAELGGSEPQKTSTMFSLRYSWFPGLYPGQSKTDIGLVTEEGTRRLLDLGLAERRGLQIRAHFIVGGGS